MGGTIVSLWLGQRKVLFIENLIASSSTEVVAAVCDSYWQELIVPVYLDLIIFVDILRNYNYYTSVTGLAQYRSTPPKLL